MQRIPLVLAFSLMFIATNVSAQVARRPQLFKDGRAEVAAARARGDTAVTLVMAAMPGENAALAGAITDLGGTIRFRNDGVDYLRALVPLDSVERLEGHPALHSVDVTKPQTFGAGDATEEGEREAQGRRSTTRAAQDAVTDSVWPPVLSDYPLTNRYSPLADMRAEQFREDHPTWDGRGVTIALIDYNPDPLLPELQVATTLDGQPTAKIVGYRTAIDIDEQDDGRWLRMTDSVIVTADQFTYDSTTFTAPRSGTFRIAMFSEARFDSLARPNMDRDLNRDGNPEGSSRLFGVLWDEETNDVWVDTDQDSSFTDETMLSDFNERPVFGVLGTDDPETAVRESVGFGVQIDREKRLVALNMGVDRHGSLVVGAAVGSRGTAGRFDGVAPGAQLVNVSEGYASYGQTEAAIAAYEDPRVDVVFFEQGSGITRPYLLRDGRLVPTVIYDRLIQQYGKPLMVPTHNYPILGGIDDFVLARGAIGIGGHEGKDNFFGVHGVRVEHEDNLLITGGYGPMGNGAMGPDVISPSNYISTARGFEEGRRFAGLFQLAPGYTIAGGTSTATPTAAGAVAVLISAAKQEGVAYDAFRIKHAITTSARYVPHLPAYKQGNGVINVAAAWEILKALDTDRDDISITSSAPVRTAYSSMLPTPNEGVGLYERDGWTAGESQQRTITFTRTSGPRDAMTFAVSWVGNDSLTYSAPSTIALPLNTPVPLAVTVAPDSHGAHTALLTLENEGVPGYAYRTLMTIIAAEPITAADSFTLEKKTEVPRPGMRSFFYQVPEGVTALKVDVASPERTVSLAVIRPDTRSASGGRGPTTGSSRTIVVNDPMPGTWEVRLSDITDTREFDWEQAKKAEPVPPTPATLTVSLLAADADVMAAAGGMVDDVSITNRLAAFTGGAVTVPVGSARRRNTVIRENEQREYEVDVPAGSSFLLVQAGNPGDRDADIDVHVYNCTGQRCRGGGSEVDPMGDESVLVRNPAAGTWKIVVDAPSVPSGSTTFEYLDVVFNPSYGTVALTDLPEKREIGARWNATAHTWTAPVEHAPGRMPFAALLVEGRQGGGQPFVVSLRELVANVGTETMQNQR